MTLILSFFANPSKAKILFLTFIVGIGGAFGAIIFHLLVYLAVWLFFGSTEDAQFVETIQALPTWYRVLVPAFGGLLVGIIYKYSKMSEVEGEGVPEVMEALAVKRGNIRPWVAPLKTITSALTIGSGGSAGREGPVIQIGSAIGSTLGQWLRLDTKQTSMLLASGAAASIAGTFGTPLAGVLFCVEILVKKVRTFDYLQLLLAALVGAYVVKSLIGHNGLVLIVEKVPLLHFSEILAYVILGALAGLIAVLFGKTLKLSTKTFSRVSLSPVLKPALGGLIIGLIAIMVPFIHEPATYTLMSRILDVTALPLFFMFTLLLAKIISTSITLGSGGSGGIFAPSLLIGIIVGSTFGSLLQQLGMMGIDPYVYALVGMASLFSAVAHAPLTATIILVEMTDQYLLLIPLAIGCFTSTFVAKRLSPDSIYQNH